LADVARLSPYHFVRAFKQSFGLPPHRYLRRLRIERAKALLADPAMSVTQIGVDLGFSETSSFSTTFRKHTGLTPTAYRRGANKIETGIDEIGVDRDGKVTLVGTTV